MTNMHTRNEVCQHAVSTIISIVENYFQTVAILFVKMEVNISSYKYRENEWSN